MAEIFVFPSYYEGFGLPVIEAMACGLPLITSNIHGIVDYSVDNHTGFTCNPKDVLGFSKAIQRLNDDIELRKRFGQYNKKISQEYDIEVVQASIRNIYRSVVDEKTSINFSKVF